MTKERDALARIQIAVNERTLAIDKIRQRSADIERRFWIRVIGEIVNGQISQSNVARTLGLSRETLRQRTRQYENLL